jgi:DNA-binding CsgD family transcriptional regulator
MGLIERDAELTALRTLFAEVIEGHGQAAMISGSVAAGKSALLRAFAEQAAGVGAHVAMATATRTEGKNPLGVVMELVGDLQPLRFSEEAARATASPRPSQQTLDELCKVFLDRAEDGPLVVQVDDVHHADPATLQFLPYLARRLKSARILLALTECTGQWWEHRPFHADLLSLPYCQRIRLHPLSRRGQSRLLAAHSDARVARRLAAACDALTGGNPLLIQALLKDNQPLGRSELTVDSAYTQAMLGSLHRGGPTMARVARALAVLQDPVSPILLARLIDLTSYQVDDVIGEMNAAGLLDAGRFRHPAARTAVLDSMTPEESALLHARAARLLHEDGVAPTVVADHLITAGTGEGWAAPVLGEAADQALAAGKPHTAISYLRLAMDTAPDERTRAKIASALARARWTIDPASATRLLPTLITAAREQRLSTRQTITLLHYLLWAGHAGEARDILNRLSSAAAHPWEPGRELEATRLLMSCLYPREMERPKPSLGTEDRWNTPPSTARRLRAATALAAALTGEPEDYDVAEVAEQVLRGHRLGDTPSWTVIVALAALICVDRLDLAAHWCDALLADNGTFSNPVERAALLSIRAMVFLRWADPVAAEQYARAALSQIAPASWGVAIGIPISTIVLAATATGRYEDAATYLGASVPEVMFETPYVLPYLQARGHYFLAIGQPSTAFEDFHICRTLARAWGFDAPGLLPWWAESAQVLAEMGRRHEAADRPRPREYAGATARSARAGRKAAAHESTPVAESAAEPALTVDGADPVAGLTEAERRVAELAARGHTNRQIAGALGITTSTVEQHLTRIYRKLRVRRRRDLRAVLPAEPRTEPAPMEKS